MKCFKYLFQFLITAGFFFSSDIIFSQKLTFKQFDSLLIDNNYWVVQNKSFDEVIAWNQKLMKQAEKQNYPTGIVWGHLNIANRYYNYGRFDEALKELDAAKEITEKRIEDNATIATVYTYYSVVYNMMKLYDLGLKYNERAVFYGKKIEDSQNKRRNRLLCISMMNGRISFTDKAKKILPLFIFINLIRNLNYPIPLQVLPFTT